MSLPAILDKCCHLEGLIMPHTKSRSSKIGNTTKVKDIQSFLSFANFLPLLHLWIFQNHSSTYVSYLLGYPWHFSDECHSAFQALKKAFTTALVLAHWIPDTQITVKTDASDYTLTTDLSIMTPNGDFHPIAFTLNLFAPDLNYNVHEKELLAILKPFKQWWHYHEGSGLLINVVTDHWNLQILFNDQNLTRQQAWWSKIPFRFQPCDLFPSQKTQNQTWHTH